MKERLQKILARAGYASRRGAEVMITDGRIRLNGELVTALGTQADLAVDLVEVDGARVQEQGAADEVYLAMNKPTGVLTTLSDPQGRRTVKELLPPSSAHRVVPVGRLDRDSEGLLIFTSDGEFAHRLAHPRYEIEKEYYAQIKGTPTEAALETLRSGVPIEGRLTSSAEVVIARPPSGFTTVNEHAWLRFVIHEGRRRQVRLMCAAVGLPVRTLVRTRIGSIELARLASGQTRALSQDEVQRLQALLGLDRQTPRT